MPSCIDGDMTIFHYNHCRVNSYPEWVWTALKRRRDFNKAKFYRYNNDTNDDVYTKCMISNFERINENYKMQDKSVKRKRPKKGYVNIQWFLDNINN